MSIHAICILAAVVCFILKAIGVKAGQIDLFSAGFAFLALAFL